MLLFESGQWLFSLLSDESNFEIEFPVVNSLLSAKSKVSEGVSENSELELPISDVRGVRDEEEMCRSSERCRISSTGEVLLVEDWMKFSKSLCCLDFLKSFRGAKAPDLLSRLVCYFHE